MFIRNLTLKRYYNIKLQKVTDSLMYPITTDSTLTTGTNNSPDLDIPKDLYSIESDDEDEDLVLLTQHLSTSPPGQYSNFRPKSVFNPTHVKGPYLQAFYQVVNSDIRIITILIILISLLQKN